jgi:lipopolysaccharide export system permease protein
LPIVFAVTIFIIFHFINTFGKKVAQENGISPFMGTWMSSMVLSPLAILLTYRATNDIGGMVNMDSVLSPIGKFFQKIPFFSAKKSNEKIKLKKEVQTTTSVLLVDTTTSVIKKIKLFNTLGLFIYMATIALAIVLLYNYNSKLMLLFGFLLLLLFSCIYSTQRHIRKLEKIVDKTFDEGTLVAFLLGFPLFFLSYLLTHFTIKEAQLSDKNHS